MSPDGAIKVLSELRDLEIFDCNHHLCGICDDVEFAGAPGAPLRIAALLVGPGAYKNRLPGFLLPLVHLLAGKGVVRVPWSAVEHVTSRITLNQTAEALGLEGPERRLRPVLQKLPFAS